MDINVDDDDGYDKSFNTKADSFNKFSFSITNILSDNFGPKPVKIEPQSPSPNDKIFRPFEIRNLLCNNANNATNHNISNDSSRQLMQNINPSSVFLSNLRLSEIFDYSTKHVSSEEKSDNSLRNSLYNSFASYPKIHEEILNNHKKYISNQPSPNLLPTSVKLPPLGSLCKTISQIGQESSSLQARSPSVSSADPTSPKSSFTDSIKHQPSSIEGLDSDDCQSEASSTKDDSQKLWPAWVNIALLH